MDPSALSPQLQEQHGGGHFYKKVNLLREALREKLTEVYRLEQYDVFMVQSVSIGLAMLSHLLHKQNISLSLANHQHYQPIDMLFPHSIAAGTENSGVQIVTHINPYTGELNALDQSTHRIVVDASHSFATNKHNDLINNGSIFLAPLHKHASVAVGLTLIAVRPEEYSMLLRSELRLFERATVSEAPLQMALETINAPGWQPFNVASIDAVDIWLPDGARLQSIGEPGLPLCCFKVPSFTPEQRQTVKELNGSYFEHSNTLRLSRWTRGQNGRPVNCTGSIFEDISKLWNIR
ncbi:hypothetical protein GA565_19935 [Rouxiella sp. S1S-2]|uniref:DUF6024 family protein n=1 Tax=Rouxiella sp. S1S-2 TaxID=2653856 RepID=UPI001264850F|nr:DUF6024 family protein [Rouxiella sp. S1S-2]KAB7898062.1 hypothetical protein GA565_19935 [Rouxiella sp. S1S-2]